MKKRITVFSGLILICTLLFTLYSEAQFKVNMGVGYSFGHSPTVEAGIGYSWPLLTVSGGFQSHTSNKVNEGALLELKFGHEIKIGDSWSILPSIGAAHHYRSTDRKNLNITRSLLGIEFGKMFREDIGVYGAFTGSGNIRILSAGVRGYF